MSLPESPTLDSLRSSYAGDDLPRRFRCELVCEDIAQEQFFRPILERVFGRGHIRVAPRRPNGGFTFVLAQAPKSAANGRLLRKEAVVLLIAVDGDVGGLQGRLEQLWKVFKAHGLGSEAIKERIAVCVPTRNIQTWTLWLQGRRNLDEATDYKRQVEAPISPRKLTEAWFSPLSKADLETEASHLPALVHGRKEIGRLQSTARR
jgi:hypothetical protein